MKYEGIDYMNFPNDMAEINEKGELVGSSDFILKKDIEIPKFVVDKQNQVKKEKMLNEMRAEREERQAKWKEKRKAHNIKIAKRLAIILAIGGATFAVAKGISSNLDSKNILREEFKIHNGFGEIDGYHIDPDLPHGYKNSDCDLDGLTLKEYAEEHGLKEYYEQLCEEYGIVEKNR